MPVRKFRRSPARFLNLSARSLAASSMLPERSATRSDRQRAVLLPVEVRYRQRPGHCCAMLTDCSALRTVLMCIAVASIGKST
jgi:hypothetical protein